MKPSSFLPASTCLLVFTLGAHAQNPLNFGSNVLTADPSGHVWADGRMYLYTSHDEECQEDFWMKDWRVFSSSDLINWQDHGAVLSVADLIWADNYAWAPDAAYKNGKYYFCFPAGTGHKDRVNPERSTKWMGIGIAESDSPTGPFKDVIGAPLWREPYANDPCLFIDDDGRAYVYFHGIGSDWMVRELADDMRRVKGDFIKMDMGGYEPKMEGPWVFKRKGKYYFTMPENNWELTYYMSDSPTGPWKYQGLIMQREGESNNHHSIVEFKGQWVLFYHRWLKGDSACDKPQRRVCAEYLYFNEDGTIQEVKRTEAGVSVPPKKSETRRAPEPLRWSGGLLRAEPAWYATAEARTAADLVLRYQSQAGAWPKNTDLLAPATDAALAEVQQGGKANTLDNGATTVPMRFLALVGNATGEAKYHRAALRGLDYLLAAQYPNGGFPQFYPLREGYYSRITYNDGAMINALELLRDVAQGREPFAFIDGKHRVRAADAVARGIDCILKTQIVQEGKLTAWCAQHDEVTLAPAWARAYEPPSVSGSESVGIVRFLMAVEQPSREIIAAVDGAVAWFRKVPIAGQRLDRIRREDGRSERLVVADPAAPPLWARFYELGTNRPLYMDRDSQPNYDFMKVSYERRSGYGYHTTAPAEVLNRDYPAWRSRLKQEP